MNLKIFKDLSSLTGINLWSSRDDVKARLILDIEKKYEFKYLGNKLAKILVVVEDSKLPTDNELYTLFNKILKSISLSLNDVFVLVLPEQINIDDHYKGLIKNFINVLSPMNILVLGNKSFSLFSDLTNEFKINQTFSLQDLITNPVNKKSAYKVLLKFKELCNALSE